jgi:hypothetical protein
LHKSSSNVSAVIDLSFSDDDLSIEHEKSMGKMAKNGDSHMLGLSDFDSIKGPNVTSI